MIEKIVIEWNFEPKDYFETDFAIEYDIYSVEIKSGIAKAILDPVYQDNSDEIINDLTRDLESRFLAVQVMTHQSFKLGGPSRYDLRKDGIKNVYLQVEDIILVTDISPVDIIVKDQNGNVISDSKQDRIDEKKWFSDTSAKHRVNDSTLDQMLKSYNSSVSDPNNELVHLYEIRDAVSKKFGGENKVRAKLNITSKEWSDFGLIDKWGQSKIKYCAIPHVDGKFNVCPDYYEYLQKTFQFILFSEVITARCVLVPMTIMLHMLYG